jgi:site-specific recombinase XerD
LSNIQAEQAAADALGHRNAHRSWTRIVKKAGVAHRGIHHMRHADGTTLAERGVHERVAQYLLGHADSRVTEEIYTHVTGTMLDQAAASIDQADGCRGRRWVQEWVQRQRRGA